MYEVQCPISGYALITDNRNSNVNHQAQTELNLFIHLSNCTIALDPQYNDNDLAVYS